MARCPQRKNLLPIRGMPRHHRPLASLVDSSAIFSVNGFECKLYITKGYLPLI